MEYAGEGRSNLKFDRKLVIIVGPTASGKTKFSIDLCRKLRDFNIISEIINADSMQVYKGFNIGTAKPSNEEMSSVPHHLFGFVDPTQDYNASMLVKDCNSLNKLPVIVGGTNLYIEAILWPSVIDHEYNEGNQSLEEEFKNFDTDTLYNKLMEVDPERARELHKNDRKRIIRSLDIYHFQGITHTDLMKVRKQERDIKGIRYDPILFLLTSDPEIHRLRIRNRVQSMLKDGIIGECREILRLKGFIIYSLNYIESDPRIDVKRGIFQSIAYKELIPLLLNSDGFDNPSTQLLEDCARVLETKTWQYSQRQKTWINNRLLKSGLKCKIVNTNGNWILEHSDLTLWDQIVDENVKAVIEHVS